MRLHIEKSAGLYLIPFYIRRGGPGYREKIIYFLKWRIAVIWNRKDGRQGIETGFGAGLVGAFTS